MGGRKTTTGSRGPVFRALTIYAVGIPAAIYGGVLGFAGASCLAIGVALWYSLFRALPMLGLRASDLVGSARGGLGIGVVVLLALQLVELLLAPTGWSRVIASAAISGPVLLLLVLRMLKGGRHPRPPADLNDPGSESVL